MDTPALFTHVSMRPKRLTASWAASSIFCRSATSATTCNASPPSEAIRPASALSVSALRAIRTSLAPRRAACNAVVNPIPLEAPVMTITCSFRGLCEAMVCLLKKSDLSIRQVTHRVRACHLPCQSQVSPQMAPSRRETWEAWDLRARSEFPITGSNRQCSSAQNTHSAECVPRCDALAPQSRGKAWRYKRACASFTGVFGILGDRLVWRRSGIGGL